MSSQLVKFESLNLYLQLKVESNILGFSDNLKAENNMLQKFIIKYAKGK